MNAECRPFLVGWAWVILVMWAFPAHARTVAVLRPELAEPSVLETSNRIHGELLAVGFSVRVVAPAREPLRESLTRLNALSEQEQLDAVIEVQAVSPPRVNVWMLTAGAEPRRIAEVSVEPGTENASEKLAIRAIDVLRSGFLERDLLNGQSAARELLTAPADSESEPSVPEVTSSVRFGFAAGITALRSLDGVGPALMPTLGFDLIAARTLTLYASAAGLGTRSRVTSGEHSVDVRHNHAVLGVRYYVTASEMFRPFAALALGLAATSIEAHAAAPAQGHDLRVDAFLMDVGLGVDWLWHDHYYTRLATHVQVANPSATVHVVDSAVASTGLPNLALTLTIGAWL